MSRCRTMNACLNLLSFVQGPWSFVSISKTWKQLILTASWAKFCCLDVDFDLALRLWSTCWILLLRMKFQKSLRFHRSQQLLFSTSWAYSHSWSNQILPPFSVVLKMIQNFSHFACSHSHLALVFFQGHCQVWSQLLCFCWYSRCCSLLFSENHSFGSNELISGLWKNPFDYCYSLMYSWSEIFLDLKSWTSWNPHYLPRSFSRSFLRSASRRTLHRPLGSRSIIQEELLHFDFNQFLRFVSCSLLQSEHQLKSRTYSTLEDPAELFYCICQLALSAISISKDFELLWGLWTQRRNL